LQKCARCKDAPPIFFRPYSGEKLCRKCFTSSIGERVGETISKYKMFSPNDKIAVAVSGGKDSLSLLHILAKIEKGFPEAKLVAVTVDEGISGYRSEAVKIASKNCRQLGVKQLTLSFKGLYGHTLDEIVEIAEGSGELTPCSYCGVLRRKALNVAAKKLGASKLATAHNLDDETQTIFLNLIHGDVMRMARVEPIIEDVVPGFVQRVKPLSEIPENEIALYAHLKNIEFQTKPCPYMHTAMRSDIRNMLNRLEVRYPGLKFTVLRSVEKIRPILRAAADKAKLRNCAMCGEPTVSEVCKPCETLQKLGL